MATSDPKPYLSPYFESARRSVDDNRKGMLEAVAQHGQAGAQAYQAQIDAANQDRAAALARAAEGAALGYASDPNVALRSYDARINLLGDTKASNAAYFDKLGASGSAYFDKVQSGLTAAEAMGINRASSQERGIEAALELQRKKEEAAAAAAAAKEQRQIDREARAEARAAAKPPKISADALLGTAAQAQKAATPTTPVDFGPAKQPNESWEQYYARLNKVAQGRRDTDAIVNTPLTDLAASIGRSLGVPETTIAEMYSPGKQSSIYNATKNLSKPVQTDTHARALATKYDTKGVTYDLARSVLGNVDFKEAVNVLTSLDPATTTWEDQEEWVRENFITRDGRNWRAEYEILMGEYVNPRFKKAG